MNSLAQSHHHFHHVCLNPDGIAMLNGHNIKVGEHLEVMFEDCHTEKSFVVSQCCDKEKAPKMFVPIKFHGKHPWILLDGMKARRC